MIWLLSTFSTSSNSAVGAIRPEGDSRGQACQKGGLLGVSKYNSIYFWLKHTWMLLKNKNTAVFVMSQYATNLHYKVHMLLFTTCFYSRLSQTLQSQYYHAQKSKFPLLLPSPKSSHVFLFGVNTLFLLYFYIVYSLSLQ